MIEKIEPSEELDVVELKQHIKQLKKEILDETESKDYEGEFDLVLTVIENIESNIKNVKHIKEVDKHTHARILADLTFMDILLNLPEDDDDIFDDLDDEDDELLDDNFDIDLDEK